MRRRLVLPLLLVSVLAACGGGGSPTEAPPAKTNAPAATTSGGGGGGDANPTPGTSLTACEVITAADIEAALDLDAGTVAAGTLKETATVLDPAANECRYTGDWGGLIVDLTPTDGVNVHDALESTYGNDSNTETLDVGDGAFWFAKNNRGYFLKGAVLFYLQFTHLAETPASGSFRDATVALGRAGVAKI